VKYSMYNQFYTSQGPNGSEWNVWGVQLSKQRNAVGERIDTDRKLLLTYADHETAMAVVRVLRGAVARNVVRSIEMMCDDNPYLATQMLNPYVY
jgi:hypothetical protein